MYPLPRHGQPRQMQRDRHNFLCGSAKALPPGLGTLVCAVQHVGHNNAIVKQVPAARVEVGRMAL